MKCTVQTSITLGNTLKLLKTRVRDFIRQPIGVFVFVFVLVFVFVFVFRRLFGGERVSEIISRPFDAEPRVIMVLWQRWQAIVAIITIIVIRIALALARRHHVSISRRRPRGTAEREPFILRLNHLFTRRTRHVRL